MLNIILFVGVMENVIVRTAPTSLRVVQRVNVDRAHSSAKTATAPLQRPFVTAPTIAVTVPTNNTATCRVLNWNSSAAPTAAAFSIAGNAMETQTVKMAQMRIQICATSKRAILKHSLHARTAVAFQNCGCATLITIVETTQTNRLTCVAKGTVPQDGKGVLGETTTDAFLSGCSVMVKTTAGINLTSYLRTAQCAIPKLTSSVTITDVFLTNGSVIFRTTAATGPMKWRRCAKGNSENAPSLSIVAITESVFRQDGGAITKTTAATIQMKTAAASSNAKTARSSVLQAIVSRHISGATETEIAETCQMRRIVPPDILVEDIVQNLDSSATITCALVRLIFATALMIVEMAPMKPPVCAQTSIATLFVGISVPITAAYRGTNFATELTIAGMAQTRTI